jgi:hypothetical protein
VPPDLEEPRSAPDGPLDVAQVRRAWRAVLEAGAGVPPGCGPLLRAADVALGAGGNEIRALVPPGSPLLERMAATAVRRPLQDALRERLGRPVGLAFSAGDLPAGAPRGGERITAETARRDRLRRLTEEEPLLASVVQEWDLELLD